MALIDILTGNRSLRRQRDATQRAIRREYDPNMLEPMATYAQTVATQGIGDGVADVARNRTLQQLFGRQDTSLYGGQAAAAIAGAQAVSARGQQAMARFEADLALQDIASRQQGAEQYAQLTSQQRQIAGARDSQLEQAQLQYESERSRRRKALGASVLSLAGTALTTPFGGPLAGVIGQSVAQRALGGLFGGGGGGTPQAPEVPREGAPQPGGLDIDSILAYADQEMQANLYDGGTDSIGPILNIPQVESPDYEHRLPLPSDGFTPELAGETQPQQGVGSDAYEDFLARIFGVQDQGASGAGLEHVMNYLTGPAQPPSSQRMEIDTIDLAIEMHMPTRSLGREISSRGSGILTGYDADGRYYPHNLSEVLQSPFHVAYQVPSYLRSGYDALQRRQEQARREAEQRLMRN